MDDSQNTYEEQIEALKAKLSEVKAEADKKLADKVRECDDLAKTIEVNNMKESESTLTKSL